MTKEFESGEQVMQVGIDFDYIVVSDRSAQKMRTKMNTFLNSYKSVVLLYDQRPGTFFGKSNGSMGCQYSMNPPSSADNTVSYLSLYCTLLLEMVSDYRGVYSPT